MILVIGGIASGKRTYVRSLGYADCDMSCDVNLATPVLCDLQDLLRSVPVSDELLRALERKDIIICCEVGQGVVPMGGDERAWRELVGRTSAELARRANKVVRMVCGIPLVIKEL